MTPSVSTVLAWRWGVATLIRLGAAGIIGWTLWTYVPILFGQFVMIPLNGRAPFYWLDPAAGLTGMAVQQRQEFYSNLRMDGLAVAAAIVLWFISGRLGVLIVRMPRALRRCPVCRYSLAALIKPRCPECGLDLPASAVGEGGQDEGTSPTAPGAGESHPQARSGTA